MIQRFVWTAATALALAAGGFTAHRARATAIDAPQADAPGQDRLFRAAKDDVITRTLPFADGGERTLDVRAIHGSILVVGTDRADVQLEVHKMIRAAREDDLRAAEREVSLDIVESRATIEAIVRETGNGTCGESASGQTREWRRPRYRVTFHFAIRVPRSTRLRLCTINGGEVSVESTAGDFEVDNVNGRVVMQNVRGSGSVRTVNGTIVASFTERPRNASEFRTTNCNLVVTFPADLAADLRMKTFNGGLFTDFDVQSLPPPVAVAERRDGGFVYRSNQFALVRAGGGGFDGHCEAAFRFYEQCLGGKITFMLTWGDSPMAKDAPPEWSAKILHASLSVGDMVLAGADGLPQGYERPRGFAVLLGLSDRTEAERIYYAFAEQGTVTVPLQETFWALRYGGVTDRFGIPWVINCEKAV